MPQKLKPSQSNFNTAKVNYYIQNPRASGLFDKIIIVSSDNYILDGHHHWKAMLEGFPHRPMLAYKVDTDIINLLQLSKRFPKALYQDVGV